MFAAPYCYHPGEGRGPIGKVGVTTRRPQPRPSPSWAPASAGVVQSGWCGWCVYFTLSYGVKSRNRQVAEGIDMPADTVRKRSFRHSCPP